MFTYRTICSLVTSQMSVNNSPQIQLDKDDSGVKSILNKST